MDILLNKYGSIISDDTVGAEILREIRIKLNQGQQVVVDFSDVISITTFNAKQIFGELYKSLGAEQFFQKIQLKNASKNIVTIVKLGIQDSLRELAA